MQEEFYKKWFIEYAKALKQYYAHDYDCHLWEWVYTIKVVQEFGFLHEGSKGLGFAVGKEPLPSFFGSRGIDIVATDLSMDDVNAKSWYDGNSNVGGKLDNVYCSNVCEKEVFYNHVTYRDVNMNELPEDLGTYDFCWSICAIEHLGSLEKGKSFLKNMLNVLKPGGIAVHTTAFNLVSDTNTIESGGTVLFRKKDIEEIKEWFLSHGCLMETSYCKGDLEGNYMVDKPPYLYCQDETENRFSLVLLQGGYIHTSYAIVVKKLQS